MIENLKNFKNDPNDFTKTMLTARMKIVQNEIDLFLQLIQSSSKFSDDIKCTLSIVLLTFDKNIGVKIS